MKLNLKSSLNLNLVLGILIYVVLYFLMIVPMAAFGIWYMDAYGAGKPISILGFIILGLLMLVVIMLVTAPLKFFGFRFTKETASLLDWLALILLGYDLLNIIHNCQEIWAHPVWKTDVRSIIGSILVYTMKSTILYFSSVYFLVKKGN